MKYALKYFTVPALIQFVAWPYALYLLTNMHIQGEISKELWWVLGPSLAFFLPVAWGVFYCNVVKAQMKSDGVTIIWHRPPPKSIHITKWFMAVASVAPAIAILGYGEGASSPYAYLKAYVGLLWFEAFWLMVPIYACKFIRLEGPVPSS